MALTKVTSGVRTIASSEVVTASIADSAITNALMATFLNRVDLKGSEVQAFNKAMAAITTMAELNSMANVPVEE